MDQYAIPPQPVFSAVRLSGSDVRRVYPLIRMMQPTITLREWQAFARRKFRSRESGGLIMLQDLRGYVHAAFSYEIDPRLARGPVLRVGSLVIGRLPGRMLNDALIGTIDDLAQALRCETVQITLSGFADEPREISIRSVLMGAGFRACPMAMIRENISTVLQRDRMPMRAMASG